VLKNNNVYNTGTYTDCFGSWIKYSHAKTRYRIEDEKCHSAHRARQSNVYDKIILKHVYEVCCFLKKFYRNIVHRTRPYSVVGLETIRDPPLPHDNITYKLILKYFGTTRQKKTNHYRPTPYTAVADVNKAALAAILM